MYGLCGDPFDDLDSSSEIGESIQKVDELILGEVNKLYVFEEGDISK